MATTGSVSNGVISLITTWNWFDVLRRNVDSTVGPGLHTIDMRGFKISVYRSLDINDQGVPTSSPYFGSVTTDRYRNRHGPITTDRISTGPDIIARNVELPFDIWNNRRDFREWGTTAFQTPILRLRSSLGTGSNGLRIRSDALNPGSAIVGSFAIYRFTNIRHSGFFSELLCAGTWVVRIRLDILFSNQNVRITDAVTVSVPSSRRCPGTGTTPQAPTSPTAPTAPTTPTQPTTPTVPGGGGGGGGGSAPPPVVVVTGSKPVIRWNDTNLFRGFRSPIDGTPIEYQGRRYADEFKPLVFQWDYYSPTNTPQKDFALQRTRYNAAGTASSGGWFTSRPDGSYDWGGVERPALPTEATRITAQGNTSGIQDPNFINTNAGWAQTPAGDNQGFTRLVFGLSVDDTGTPAQRSDTQNLIIHPYQGMRLSPITTYNAGANNYGFQIHYYAAGVTANTQARGNEVRFHKWAIYRRADILNGRPRPGVRPVAGTVRDQDQTFDESGAHFIDTGWAVGYQIAAADSPTGQAITEAPNVNPNDTRLRIAFDGTNTGNTKGVLEDGQYTIRAKLIDQFGNALGSAAYDFTVARPASIAMTTTPRVYDKDDNLQPGLTGVIPGRYVGLNISVDGNLAAADGFHTDDGEGGYVIVERKEYDRPQGEVNETPKIVSPPIRPTGTTGTAPNIKPVFPPLFTDSAGRQVVFRDYQVARGVQYLYRLVAVNRYGNKTTSAWAPV